MMYATIKATVPHEKREELLLTFKSMLGPIRREHGCSDCHCSVDIEDENLIYLSMEWQTKRNLDSHLRSPLFSVLLGAMKLLEKEPEINFVTTATRQVRWK